MASPARLVRLLLLAALVLWPLASRAASKPVVVLEIDGPIGPAVSEYVQTGLEHAQQRDAEAVVLRMDTPGGLDASMRDIIRGILASPVPVVGYVAPQGARAASAGTYILYACHVAAMAPATNLGAATPVQIGGLPSPGGGGEDGGEDDGSTAPKDPMKRKLVNDARAYMRGLANLRGRNAQWAEQSVSEAASLAADEALARNVIDLIAEDLDSLRTKIDGREVTALGNTVTMQTADAPVERTEPGWRNRLLSVISNPNIAYLLMLLGVYGLLFELANPGFVLPGVVGAIALILALFAFQTLPINWAGLVLMLLGVAFMVAEAFVTSFGALGIGGVVAFVVGSIILIDTGSDFFSISKGLIAGVAIVSALFSFFVIGLAIRSKRSKIVSGREELADATGVALADFDDRGQVRVHGEIWNARTSQPLTRGQPIRVNRAQGLTLWVDPAPDDTRPPSPQPSASSQEE